MAKSDKKLKPRDMPDEPCTIVITGTILHDYPILQTYGYVVGDLIYCADLETIQNGGTLARDHERPVKPPHNG